MDMAIIPALEPAFGEIILAVGAMALLMFGAFAGQRATSTINGIAIALLAGALLVLFLEPGQRSTFSDAFILDDFARLMKGLVLLGSAVAIAMSVGYAKAERFERFEYPILIVIATVGMMMMISAGDLISMYLGLELQSLALYVVAAINRDSVRSTEAGVKFFVLGALSSGMLLYGASLVYGFTGQTSFEGISAVMLDADRSLGLVFGLVFVLAGLAFKISAVPFHMWTPDVYEGAPTPVTAFFAGAPKLAAMALFLRVTVDGFQPLTVDWQQIVSFLAIASMLLGAFAGIGQRNIKRLMAYSSIGHMGYALIGLAAGSVAGVGGVVLYLIVYLVMTLATFACILAMRRGEETFEEIGELAGLWQSQPGVALALGALMFSLAGFPPLGGFFAKYLVFSAAVEAELTWLAVIGALSSVVSCFYYLRIVKIAFFDEPSGRFDRMPAELGAVLGVGALFILFFVFFIGPLGQVAEVAARSLF